MGKWGNVELDYQIIPGRGWSPGRLGVGDGHELAVFDAHPHEANLRDQVARPDLFP